MIRALLLLVLVAAAFVLGVCGDGGDDSYRPPPAQTADDANVMRSERDQSQTNESEPSP